MTGQPHPQRCETCDLNHHHDGKRCPYDNADDYYRLKEEMRFPRAAWLFTSIVGCASHSSRPTQASNEALIATIDEKIRAARDRAYKQGYQAAMTAQQHQPPAPAAILPTCNYAACRIFEECANAYDDDEAPPCTKYQSKEHDAAIRQQEREWWMLRVKAILQKTRFYDELDTALQELVQEATDGSSTPTAQEHRREGEQR